MSIYGFINKNFIDKAISNKNIVKLFDIYIEYINNYKFIFLSNDMYKTVFNLKNKWASFRNSIHAFKFLLENMKWKVLNLDEYVRVYKNSIVDHHILNLLNLPLLDLNYYLYF